MLRRLLLGCGLATALGCSEALISLFPAAGSSDVSIDAATPDAHALDAATPDARASDAATPDARASDAGQEPVPGLVSHWTFEANATDSVGGNNGHLLGGSSFVVDPTRGEVLSCNGTDAGVSVANTAGLSFSYTAWIWSNTPSHTGSSAVVDGDILVSSAVASAIDDFAFAVLDDRLSYINYNQSSSGVSLVTNGQWHQVAFTRQDGGRVTLYVDGKIDGGGNSGTGDVAASAAVYFCGGSSGGHYFRGLIDDVRLYDHALSPAELASLFAAAG